MKTTILNNGLEMPLLGYEKSISGILRRPEILFSDYVYDITCISLHAHH